MQLLSYCTHIFIFLICMKLKVQKKYAEAIAELKEEAKSMLMAKGTIATARGMLVLIDTLERLGVAYHFDQEIENQLLEIFNLLSHDDDDIDDLFTTALGFRLLRQHRHHANSS